MKVLYIFRKGVESDYILGVLLNKTDSCTILETGSIAKKAKLKRMFAKTPLYLLPLRVLDLVCLGFYSVLFDFYIKIHLSVKKIKPSHVVDDVNQEQCIKYIKKTKPNIIVIFGTAIVRGSFFRKIKIPVFNIHTGIVPMYRNVHSEFWAYKNKDYQNIGISLIYLDKGIDSGDVVLQRRIGYLPNNSLFSLKLKNLQLIAPSVLKLVLLFSRKKLPRVKQNKKDIGFYPTPKTFDFIKLFLNA